ncbi:unnamed protein product, partial [Prorocentrum cordatum]
AAYRVLADGAEEYAASVRPPTDDEHTKQAVAVWADGATWFITAVSAKQWASKNSDDAVPSKEHKDGGHVKVVWYKRLKEQFVAIRHEKDDGSRPEQFAQMKVPDGEVDKITDKFNEFVDNYVAKTRTREQTVDDKDSFIVANGWAQVSKKIGRKRAAAE